MVAPVELVRELLQYRDMNVSSGRDWAFITAMCAGGSLAFPILAPVAVGSMVALGVTKVRALRARKKIAGVELPPVPRAANARTVVGVARRFRAGVASLVGDGHVLAEHAVVRDRAGGVLIRRAASAPFLIERTAEDGGPLLVAGALRLVSPATLGMSPRRLRVGRGDAMLAQMGVPADLGIAGDLEATVIHDRDDTPPIAVTGVIEDEAVADLAFHRDGGHIAVMRGVPGAPVLVEDLRLVARGA